jgi:hypothetical protein
MRLPELRISLSWQKGWSEEIQKLQASAKFIIEQSLRELLVALQACKDPMLDVALQRWSPTKWDVPRKIASAGKWVEYRLGDDENRARAIICHDPELDAIHLVARTPIHDHASLRQLIAEFRPK